MDDYIENMRKSGDIEDYLSMGSHKERDLALSGGSEWEDTTGSDAAGERRGARPDRNGWSPADLEDFAELSTSDEQPGDIQEILSSRARINGMQYLVVYEEQTIDDARWIPLKSLEWSERALQLIREFRAEEELMRQFGSDSGSGEDQDEDDDEDDSEYDSDDDPEEVFRDEEDLIQRKIDRMDDETMARLLAKQEELGLGSDELLLFDDDDSETLDLSSVLRPSRRNGGKNAKNGRGRPKGDFPSATMMAEALEHDPYGGFDVMDRERPSLKRKPKGRKGTLPFELSDSELESSLQDAWAADRRKKRLKKQEREEIRAQGLLGKKNKFRPDLKAKYKEGMSLTSIKIELRQFLTSTEAQ